LPHGIISKKAKRQIDKKANWQKGKLAKNGKSAKNGILAKTITKLKRHPKTFRIKDKSGICRYDIRQ